MVTGFRKGLFQNPVQQISSIFYVQGAVLGVRVLYSGCVREETALPWRHWQLSGGGRAWGTVEAEWARAVGGGRAAGSEGERMDLAEWAKTGVKGMGRLKQAWRKDHVNILQILHVLYNLFIQCCL